MCVDKFAYLRGKLQYTAKKRKDYLSSQAISLKASMERGRKGGKEWRGEKDKNFFMESGSRNYQTQQH